MRAFTREASEILDIDPSRITIVIEEYESDHWAVNGEFLSVELAK